MTHRALFKNRKGIATLAVALAILPQSLPAFAADLFDVADTVVSYNRERAEKEIAEALWIPETDSWWKNVSSGLMLRKEETYAKIEKEIADRLSKVSSPWFAAGADSGADGFVTLAKKFLSDGNSGLLFVVGYGNGDVVSAGNSYYYVYPFEAKGDPDAVKYVREKVSAAASESEEAFVEACSKYRIRYAKVADSMKATAYVGESRGAKKDMPLTMFSSTRNPIPDKEVLDSVKARHWLFYFGYVSSDELRSYFGGKKDMELRGMDSFVSIGSETLFTWVVEPQKLLMEAKVSDLGVFHTAEYSKKTGELPITVAFALAGIAFGTAKALGFRSRQRTLLAMTGDRI